MVLKIRSFSICTGTTGVRVPPTQTPSLLDYIPTVAPLRAMPRYTATNTTRPSLLPAAQLPQEADCPDRSCPDTSWCHKSEVLCCAQLLRQRDWLRTHTHCVKTVGKPHRLYFLRQYRGSVLHQKSPRSNRGKPPRRLTNQPTNKVVHLERKRRVRPRGQRGSAGQ